MAQQDARSPDRPRNKLMGGGRLVLDGLEGARRKLDAGLLVRARKLPKLGEPGLGTGRGGGGHFLVILVVILFVLVVLDQSNRKRSRKARDGRGSGGSADDRAKSAKQESPFTTRALLVDLARSPSVNSVYGVKLSRPRATNASNARCCPGREGTT